MRKIAIGTPPQMLNPSQRDLWIMNALIEMQRASHDQIAEEIADAYTLSNYTVTRTLDASTATAGDIANVLATFLQDMKNRGTKRG